MLFVPANDERKIRKVLDIKPDSVIFDLEDSVPVEEKENARNFLLKILKEMEFKNIEVCVRINSIYTIEGLKDIIALTSLDNVNCIVIPKAEGDLSFIHKITGKNLMGIIETPKGITKIEEIARSEGIVAITWGPADLALSIGGNIEAYESNIFIRTLIPIVASAYGIDAIDKVYFNVEDIEGFKKECYEAKKLGYVGKTLIHPNQVNLANEIFKPTKEEIEWAKKIVDIYQEYYKKGKGAIKIEGKLIDYVHYKLAKKILEKIREE
jgi:Citrate lyase beta subunit